MIPSWRKPAGMFIILALLTAWCVGVASLSGWVGQWPWWGQLPFYVIAGVAWLWVLPLRRLLLWMDQGRWK